MWDAALSQKSKDGRFERSHFSRIQPSCRRKQRKQSLTQKGLENKNPLYRSRHTALIRLKGGGIILPMMLCKSDTRASVQVLGFPNADTVRFLSSFFMLDEHWTASMEPTASLWHTNRTMISNLLVVCFFVFVCVCVLHKPKGVHTQLTDLTGVQTTDEAVQCNHLCSSHPVHCQVVVFSNTFPHWRHLMRQKSPLRENLVY